MLLVTLYAFTSMRLTVFIWFRMLYILYIFIYVHQCLHTNNHPCLHLVADMNFRKERRRKYNVIFGTINMVLIFGISKTSTFGSTRIMFLKKNNTNKLLISGGYRMNIILIAKWALWKVLIVSKLHSPIFFSFSIKSICQYGAIHIVLKTRTCDRLAYILLIPSNKLEWNIFIIICSISIL